MCAARVADFKKQSASAAAARNRERVAAIDDLVFDFHSFSDKLSIIKKTGTGDLRFSANDKDGVPHYDFISGHWRAIFRVEKSENETICEVVGLEQMDDFTRRKRSLMRLTKAKLS